MKETSSPYLAGQQEMRDRNWQLVQSLSHWRMISIGCIVATVVSSAGLAYVSSQQKVIPFLVEHNEHAEPVRIIRLDTPNSPSANHIRAALRTWLIGARSVIGDMDAMKDMLDQTYIMMLPASDGYRELHEWHKENNPYQLIDDHRVAVTVNSVLLLGGDTWQVEWTEKKRGQKENSETQWQARVTVKIVPPSTEEQVMKNPGGIFVKDFSWSRRL